MFRVTLGAAAAGLLLVQVAPGFAQAPYPSKPVRILVGYPPGGGTDILARAVAVKLNEAWGQPVVVENRPGASTVIASEMLAKSPPDGYTLINASAVHAINASTFKKLPYDPVKDFQPIAFIAMVPNVLLVHPSLPVKTVKDLTALAKAKPGQLDYGSTGASSPYQIAAEMYKMMTGTNIVHVPYKGAAPALTALLAGEVTVMFGNVVSSMPFVKGGRTRAIAVTTEKRSGALPDVPTMAESGLKGYVFASWFGLMGPAGMPAPVVTKIHADTMAVLKSPELNARLTAEGAELQPMTPAQFSEHVRVEIERIGKVVKAGNITAE
jgi:tripartite-type tricarboxylate transporter receptor subunit TctC